MTTKEQRKKKAQRDLRNAIQQLQYHAEEIERRSFADQDTICLAKQLKLLCDSLLEWGTFEGRIEVWGCFTPTMVDYNSTDVLYGEGVDSE